MKNAIKILLIIVGGMLIAYPAILLTTVNVSIGVFLPMFLGIPLLLYGVFYHKLKALVKEKKIFKGLRICFIALYCAFSIVFIVTLGFMLSATDSDENESVDALIVLGGGLKNDEPSATLARRLDKAVQYYDKNRDVIIVVTGGLGQGKSVSEAQAMATYLIKKNVPSSQILLEEKATDTNENFTFSKQILDDYFKAEYTMGFATSDFHAYRSNLIANKNNLEPNIYTNSTAWYYLPSAVLRECFSILKEWIFG